VLTRALICPFLDLYPTYHPTGGVQVLQKAWNRLSDDVKAILQIAESNLNALNTFHLGPKRPFSEGECALWARLTGPRFDGQVAAERSTPIKFLRSLQYTNALISNGITTLNLLSEFTFMVNFKMKLHLEVFQQAPFI